MTSGHTDNDPSALCAASTNDALAWVEGSCTPIGTGGGENAEAEQRRTFQLSSGEVLWDLSGNAMNWTSTGGYSTGKVGPLTGWQEYSAVYDGASLLVSDLIPTNGVKIWWDDSWDSNENIGQYYSVSEGSGGTIRRGGSYLNNTTYGLFTVSTSYVPTDTGSRLGFRCVATPP